MEKNERELNETKYRRERTQDKKVRGIRRHIQRKIIKTEKQRERG